MVNVNDLKIVIPTHSNYIDICNIFMQLFKRNWPDCPYPIYGAVIGDDKTIPGCQSIYCGSDQTLTDAVFFINKKYPTEFTICFLGDAFITGKVNQADVEKLIKDVYKDRINYCRLVTRTYEKKHLKKRQYRLITGKDVYCFSFVAFIASHNFIESEFKNSSDLEFEKKYLEKSKHLNHNYIYDDSAILVKNVFHIIPGINKGKWDRHVYRRLQKVNPALSIGNRPKLSIYIQARTDIIDFFQFFLPIEYRHYLKKTLAKLGMKFVTDC